MKAYDIHRAYSGVEDSEIWVSLCYTSEEGEDVLHIVCAREVDEQDRRLGQNTIYLCGDDQARSCYAGADKITASKVSVQVHLNKHGLDSLELRKPIELRWGSRTPGKVSALRCLGRMKKFECGQVVHAVESSRSCANGKPGEK